jgi:hypothetical protein
MSDLARDTIKDAFYQWNMITTQWVSRIGISVGANVVPAVFIDEINMKVSLFRKDGNDLVIFSIL